VALLVLLVAGSWWVVTDARARPKATRSELCDKYTRLVGFTSGGDWVGTQQLNRSARRLSLLAEGYDEDSATGGAAAAGLAVRQAADDARTVLRSVAWETDDLLTATRPIALECGWIWPVTAEPPAQARRPPS
jgi:hypothetical protein